MATIYIDNMKAYHLTEHRMFCQMWSSDTEALHRMASRLRVGVEFFRDHIPGFQYYDIPFIERKEALRNGVTPVTIRGLYKQVRLTGSTTHE